MRNLFIKYLLLFAIVNTFSCSPPDESSSSSGYSYGVLSSEVLSYSAKEMTLKVKFFVLDKENSDQLTTKNIENNLTLQSYDVSGLLIDYSEVLTPFKGSSSCAVLVDEIFNLLNYDYHSDFSSTDTFLRKFFKNSGINSTFLFSTFDYTTPAVKFYGKGYTDDASELDLQMAIVLHNVNKPTSVFSNIPLLQCIDILLDTINSTAIGDNRNLLLFSSRASYMKTVIPKDSVINKAKRMGIRVSTIMDYGGEYYIDYDLEAENMFYDIAFGTGGFVHRKSNNEKDFLVLASQLGNIMQGNFRCFEATWKIVPDDSYTEPFQPGFFAEGDLEIDLGTQYLSNVIELPFRIIIK